MNLKNKNILVLGLGVSGISSAKALAKMGAKVVVNDSKNIYDLANTIEELKGFDITFKLGTEVIDLNDIDLVIKSPGIPLDAPIILNAQKKGIEVITDIEIASRISSNTFVAITGTNGKTTTTTLVGEIIKNWGKKCHVTGNIGVGILWELINSFQDDFFVIEASSFQLESTRYFKPKVSVITNITPDHINWHKTLENYISSKSKIFKNQDENCFTVLNYDDPIVKKLGCEVKSNLVYFSQKQKLKEGVYLEDEYIVVSDGNIVTRVLPYKDVRIPGRHNLENAMAAVGVGWVLGIPLNVIAHTLKTFEGVEHRLEFVTSINGVNFINDSKGTNPDASIKAIEAIESPIILIAGGYDKGNEFTDFVKSFNDKVKALILIGETAQKIKETAISLGFSNIYIVNTMEDAVNKSFNISKSGDNVLLSPACASWDMYSSFEERGKDFKKAVKSLRRPY